MSNNRNINTILLILIFIVLSIGVYLFMGNKKVGDSEPLGQIPEIENPNSVVWVKSEKFGLYFPANFNAPNEFYRVSGLGEDRGKIVYEPSTDTVPVFSLVFADGDAVITWGDVWKGGYIPGTCTQSEFGPFEYGVSSVACVNGYRTWVAHFSARDSISKDDLKIFGDFVMKNQVNKTSLITYENKELGFSFESPYGEVQPMSNGKFISINKSNSKEDKGEMLRGDISKNPIFYFAGLSRDYNAGRGSDLGESKSENCASEPNKKTTSGVEYKYLTHTDEEGYFIGERNSKAYVAYFKMKSSYNRFPCLAFTLWPQKSGVTEAEFLKIMNSVKLY